jgi:hypothetical protein
VERASRLIGRVAEAAAIEAVRTRARVGDGGLLLVTGPAGMGKSALIRHTVGADTTTIIGRTSPPPAPTAQPLAEIALAILRRGADPTAPALGIHRGALRVLLPAADLGVGETEQPSPMHVVDAVLALHEQLAARRADTLVIEDAQWADAFTLQAVEYAADRLRGAQACLIVTARPAADIAALTQRLVQRHAADLVELPALRDDDIVAMIAACLGAPASLEDLEAVGRAGGLPLAIEEILAARDASATAAGSRLDALADDERMVLEAAALVGRAFDPSVLASALEASDRFVDEALRSGLRLGLLAPEPGALRPWFAHELVREEVLTAIAPTRIARLASRLSVELATTGRPDDLERAARAGQRRRRQGGRVGTAVEDR